jgi:hypothetical protein
MILSVHATFGAAVASLVPTHPGLAFCLGFVSHLALDAIPHQDYDLLSVSSGENRTMQNIDSQEKKKRRLRDVRLVSFDALIGFTLASIFFFNPVYPWIFFLGALGAVLPDFFTFLFLILRYKPLVIFYNWHSNFFHSKIDLKIGQLTGIILQFCTLVILLAVLFEVKYLALI